MNCERARESFSDYIEGSLDRRSTLAMEAHLAACRHCLSDVDGVRHAWADLSAVPVTPPPPGLAEQTISAIRREHDRARDVAVSRPSLLDWLRSLTPARVAFATGLATLIVAGAFIAPRFLGDTLGGNVPDILRPHRPPQPAPPALDVGITYGAATDTTQVVDINLRADRNIPAVTAEVQELQPVKSNEFTLAGHGTLVAAKPYSIPINLPRGGGLSGLIVKVTSPTVGYSHDFYCAIPPGGAHTAGTVSATFVDTPLQNAVSQLAEKTGRPVVMDASLGSALVTASVSEVPAADAWAAVLRPLHLRADDTGDAYRVVPAE